MEQPVTIYEYAIVNGEYRKYVHESCVERKRFEIVYFQRKSNSKGIWLKAHMLDTVSKNHIFTLHEDDKKNFTLLLEAHERRVEEYRLQLEKAEAVLAELKKNGIVETKAGVNPLVEQIMEFEPTTLMIMGWLDNQGYKDVYSFDSGHKPLFLWNKEGLSQLNDEQLAKLLEDIQMF